MVTGGAHARQSWPLAVLLIFVLAGLLFAAAAATSEGSDLRPVGGDVASLVKERAARAEQRREEARQLQAEVDSLSGGTKDSGTIDALVQQVAKLRDVTGLVPARGPGIRVELTDAPRSVEAPPGVDPNVLVVHQQDLQAFVNALWAGGAEAISLQGQRLMTTTGIKCVGSTVVLDGVPYAPPYVIEAVGDVAAMSNSLYTSPEVENFVQYVQRYQLGLDIKTRETMTLEPYGGTVSLRWASAVR